MASVVGDKFDFYEELAAAFKVCKQNNFTKLWKSESRSVEKCQVLKDVQKELIYSEIKSACCHGG